MRRTLTIILDDDAHTVETEMDGAITCVEILGMAKHLEILATISTVKAVRAEANAKTDDKEAKND